jgi:hypothetical protein
MRIAPLLRARVASFAMFGIFLLPVAFSSLRGLTHVLTCEEESDVPFTMVVDETAAPTIITSNEIAPGEPAGFCDGLTLDMRAGRAPDNKIEMIVALTNRSHSFWKGSVGLNFGSQSVPISIGGVPAKSTRTETVRLNLGPGVHDLEGTLFVGP